MSYSILYYTANRPKPELAEYVRSCIDAIREPESQTVCVTHDRVNWGDVEIVRGKVECGLSDQYRQILAGIDACEHDTVFLAEDDVLYPPGHYEWRANGRRLLAYDLHMCRMNELGFWPDFRQIDSGCCGSKRAIKEAAEWKLGELDAGRRVRWSELGAESPSTARTVDVSTKYPFLDVRWGGNLTGRREAREGKYHIKLPFWGEHKALAERIGLK